jgi:hypothetical protein
MDVEVSNIEWTPNKDKVLFLARNPNTEWWMPYSPYVVYVFGTDGALLSTRGGLMVLGPAVQAYELAMGLITGPKNIGRVEVQVLTRSWRPTSTFPGFVMPHLIDVGYAPAERGVRVAGLLAELGPRPYADLTVTSVLRDGSGRMLDGQVVTIPNVRSSAPSEFNFLIVGAPSSAAKLDVQVREHPNNPAYSLTS